MLKAFYIGAAIGAGWVLLKQVVIPVVKEQYAKRGLTGPVVQWPNKEKLKFFIHVPAAFAGLVAFLYMAYFILRLFLCGAAKMWCN